MEPYVLTGQLEQSEALLLPFTLLVAPRGQLFERRGRMCMRIRRHWGEFEIEQQDRHQNENQMYLVHADSAAAPIVELNLPAPHLAVD